MALKTSTITTEISKLQITGVKSIRAIEKMKVGITHRDMVLMMPAPDPVSDYEPERMSQGGGSVALWTVKYQLHYRVFVATVKAGNKRGFGPVKKKMVDVWDNIFTSLLTSDHLVTAIDMVPQAPTSFEVVPDPTGKEHFGFDFDIEITEFIN